MGSTLPPICQKCELYNYIATVTMVAIFTVDALVPWQAEEGQLARCNKFPPPHQET